MSPFTPEQAQAIREIVREELQAVGALVRAYTTSTLTILSRWDGEALPPEDGVKATMDELRELRRASQSDAAAQVEPSPNSRSAEQDRSEGEGSPEAPEGPAEQGDE